MKAVSWQKGRRLLHRQLRTEERECREEVETERRHFRGLCLGREEERGRGRSGRHLGGNLVACRWKGLGQMTELMGRSLQKEEAEKLGGGGGAVMVFRDPEGGADQFCREEMTSCQKWLHNLRGSVQNENAGLF